MASREEDKAIAGLLQKSLAADASRGAPAGKDCPAPEILAAYFDRALDAQETARYDLHFSQCSHCREQLAAMARASGGTSGDKKSTSMWNWLHAPAWLMPAAAAFALLVVIAGITLHKQHATQIANEVAMARPEPALPPSPENRAPAASSPAGAEAGLPAPPSRVSKSQKLQIPPPGSTRENPAEPRDSRALVLNGQKKLPEVAKPSRPQNAPAAPLAAPAKPSADENAIVVQAPPSSSAETVEVAPRKSASDSDTDVAAGGITPEVEAKRPNPSKAKASPRASASAGTAASGSHSATGSFAAHNALESAERARTQQMQLASNLSGLTVRTPNSNVLWLVSDGGDVGRSEDGGATWKFSSLGLHGLFVSGSSPTAKVCWLLAEHGAIFRTTDGKTWTEIPFPAAANDSEFEHIEAKDELTAAVTEADGRKFSTSDGGKTWTPTK
ncbi:MAG: hypothetical protein WAU89_00660 [Candidatus Acidiferrales bacterium]